MIAKAEGSRMVWNRTNRFILSAVAASCFFTSVMAMDPDEPVDARKATRGTCAKKELSTERGCLSPPEVVHKVSPEYPRETLSKKLNSRVVLSILIELDGTVSHAEVVESDRPGNGFEESTLRAVKQWKYKPGFIEGKPIRVLYTVITTFTVD